MDTEGETLLTPNHLLQANASVSFPPTCTNEEDYYGRLGWHDVQYLDDLFWSSQETTGELLLPSQVMLKDRNFAEYGIVLAIDSSVRY